MKLSNVRLLVQNYKKCFKFYTEDLGLEPLWGDIEGEYASFKVADGIEGLAIFPSDYMAEVVGNAGKGQPSGYRDKSVVVLEVPDVDEAYRSLSAKGVAFINEPKDMPDWSMRVVHLRDPEENLIELFTPLAIE